MEKFFQPFDFKILSELLLSLILGGTIGLERQVMGKAAGLRTHALISLGSCIFTYLSLFISINYKMADPTRIPAMILTGIGFIGAGAIIQARGHIQGLTTAASIWATASVGMACGFGNFTVAFISTLLILFILHILSSFETKISILKSMTISFSSSDKLYEFLKELEKEKISLQHCSIKIDKEKGYLMEIEGMPQSIAKIIKKENL